MEILSKTESPLDEDNMKTVTEIVMIDGKKYLRVTKIKVKKEIVRVPRIGIYRFSKKFGACDGKPFGIEKGVTVELDEENLDLSGEVNDMEEKTVEKKVIKCRTCGEEGHWTAKCNKNIVEEKPKKYIPPSFKNKKEYTVKISNLPSDTTKKDVYNLMNRFGNVERCNLVYDDDIFKGLCFVSFSTQAQCEKAIEALNERVYNFMIIHLEMALPRN